MDFSGPVTGSVSHAVAVDTRIFWTAQDAGELYLFCWQTVTELPCGDFASIASLAAA